MIKIGQTEYEHSGKDSYLEDVNKCFPQSETVHWSPFFSPIATLKVREKRSQSDVIVHELFTTSVFSAIFVQMIIKLLSQRHCKSMSVETRTILSWNSNWTPMAATREAGKSICCATCTWTVLYCRLMAMTSPFIEGPSTVSHARMWVPSSSAHSNKWITRYRESISETPTPRQWQLTWTVYLFELSTCRVEKFRHLVQREKWS